MTDITLPRSGFSPGGHVTLSLAAVACAFVLVVRPAACAETGNLVFQSTVTTNDATVRLANIADVTSLPKAIRTRAGDLVVLTLPLSISTIRVDAQRVAESARRQMPVLAPWLMDVRTQSIQVTRTDPPQPTANRAPTISCVELQQDMSADTAPVGRQLPPVDCGSSRLTRAWRYDREAHVIRAARPLVAGEIVVTPDPHRMATVRRGDTVTHNIQIGAVNVARNGTVLTDTTGDRFTAIQLDDGTTMFSRSHSLGVH